MPTYLPKGDALKRRWFLIDGEGVVLGKLATATADILTGKRKPIYTPFLDTGDHVVIVNAARVRLTGRKETAKLYRRHSGFIGGLKTTAAADVRAKHPTRLVEDAVRGMLPKTRLGRAMFRKLKVYAGPSHRQQSQRPEALKIQ